MSFDCDSLASWVINELGLSEFTNTREKSRDCAGLLALNERGKYYGYINESTTEEMSETNTS